MEYIEQLKELERKRIDTVRKLRDEEVSSLFLSERHGDTPPIVIECEDGSALIPAQDPELNGPGWIEIGSVE